MRPSAAATAAAGWETKARLRGSEPTGSGAVGECPAGRAEFGLLQGAWQRPVRRVRSDRRRLPTPRAGSASPREPESQRWTPRPDFAARPPRREEVGESSSRGSGKQKGSRSRFRRRRTAQTRAERRPPSPRAKRPPGASRECLGGALERGLPRALLGEQSAREGQGMPLPRAASHRSNDAPSVEETSLEDVELDWREKAPGTGEGPRATRPDPRRNRAARETPSRRRRPPRTRSPRPRTARSGPRPPPPRSPPSSPPWRSYRRLPLHPRSRLPLALGLRPAPFPPPHSRQRLFVTSLVAIQARCRFLGAGLRPHPARTPRTAHMGFPDPPSPACRLRTHAPVPRASQAEDPTRRKKMRASRPMLPPRRLPRRCIPARTEKQHSLRASVVRPAWPRAVPTRDTGSRGSRGPEAESGKPSATRTRARVPQTEVPPQRAVCTASPRARNVSVVCKRFATSTCPATGPTRGDAPSWEEGKHRASAPRRVHVRRGRRTLQYRRGRPLVPELWRRGTRFSWSCETDGRGRAARGLRRSRTLARFAAPSARAPRGLVTVAEGGRAGQTCSSSARQSKRAVSFSTI